MSSKYRIPDWVRVNFNKEFFDLLVGNLKKNFNDSIAFNRYALGQRIGTIGLGNAIQDTFSSLGRADAVDYYKMLDWSDSDMFDWELMQELLDRRNEGDSRLRKEVYNELMYATDNGVIGSDSLNEACLVAAGIVKRVCDFVEEQGEIALAAGSEWLYQSDKGQVAAIGLVGDILDDLEGYQELKEGEN